MSIPAILVAALACFIIGFLAHGPVFGKLWMKLANITPTGNEKLSDMYGKMAWNYVMNVITAFVLSGIILTGSIAYGSMSWGQGAIAGAFMWLGFVVTGSSMEVIWLGRKFKYWLFEVLVALVSFAVMGAILAAWMM